MGRRTREEGVGSGGGGVAGGRRRPSRGPDIAGEATPGSVVRVNEYVVVVDKTGRFKQVVALQEGRNRVKVTAVDAAGRSSTETLDDIVLDTRPPPISQGTPQWE